jgi:hypothetical protein
MYLLLLCSNFIYHEIKFLLERTFAEVKSNNVYVCVCPEFRRKFAKFPSCDECWRELSTRKRTPAATGELRSPPPPQFTAHLLSSQNET